MIKQMLTKDERKLFSKRNINRIKRTDFIEYIQMYEAQLESLKQGYSPEVYKNPIIENIIEELEAFIEQLNSYYYSDVITRRENFTMEYDKELEKELMSGYEGDLKPLDRQITKEFKKIK